jgi:hypothetical protein
MPQENASTVSPSGNPLAAILTENGWSFETATRKVAKAGYVVSRQQLFRVANGESAPSFDLAVALEAAFKIPTEEWPTLAAPVRRFLDLRQP